ncbi:hypothetical protein QBC34DRAFT_408257 [Podospora aff. communis PSN243]|uniref:Secreted protein n=1 Tax=Podospora aff. communis PSN243 TaxID=3040156 RepID=A0AAV9GJQ7_9PEZI|nr:hypothetical protein QBC34DRAFT_408257 [Podospora aff. communis PSN243]
MLLWTGVRLSKRYYLPCPDRTLLFLALIATRTAHAALIGDISPGRGPINWYTWPTERTSAMHSEYRLELSELALCTMHPV